MGCGSSAPVHGSSITSTRKRSSNDHNDGGMEYNAGDTGDNNGGGADVVADYGGGVSDTAQCADYKCQIFQKLVG
ncbi:unnamed protein product [Rotaria sp. Silwood1]|nr:unnamed protein product [Rotaria sp. Silwood1]CAF5000930.1 unnamed protein product [Rotaria sp. Silwood1]